MKTESSCSAERRLNVLCDVSDVLFPSQKHESVCVSQPWQVSSSRPCEEEPQPDTIRPPPNPPALTVPPTWNTTHTNGSEKSLPSSPTDLESLTAPQKFDSSSIHFAPVNVFVDAEATADVWNRKCVRRLHVEAALPQRRSAMWGVDCGWGGAGVCECCAESWNRLVWLQKSVETEQVSDQFEPLWDRKEACPPGASAHDITEEGLSLIGQWAKKVWSGSDFRNRFVLDIQFDFSVVSGLR